MKQNTRCHEDLLLHINAIRSLFSIGTEKEGASNKAEPFEGDFFGEEYDAGDFGWAEVNETMEGTER